MTADADGPRGAADREPDTAEPYAAALAVLPGAGPAALTHILLDWAPEEAWRRIRDGRLVRPRSRPSPRDEQLDFGDPGAPSGPGAAGPRSHSAAGSDGAGNATTWRQIARRMDPPGWWARYAAAAIRVTWPGRPDYPSALINDPERPGVLFWRGELGHLAWPCVAIVGTRRATPSGRSVAFELGRDLAAAGVCVVSGLALGIDGAAHAGALNARASAPATGPAGVAASGVDVPYPRRHAGLWHQVARSGLILSETPPGRPPQAWRFPARNRIIAGLAAMVVVVESHAAGGSLITAEAAMARGVEVRVVPGPVHSSASAGSNHLLYDGAGPVRSAQDVLDGLGIFLAPDAAASALRGSGVRGPAGRPDLPDSGAAPLSPQARRVLDAVEWQPTLLGQVVDRTGLPLAAASRALELLEAAGLVGRSEHWWVRRSGP